MTLRKHVLLFGASLGLCSWLLIPNQWLPWEVASGPRRTFEVSVSGWTGKFVVEELWFDGAGGEIGISTEPDDGESGTPILVTTNQDLMSETEIVFLVDTIGEGEGSPLYGIEEPQDH